jgi:hypothetical protein
MKPHFFASAPAWAAIVLLAGATAACGPRHDNTERHDNADREGHGGGKHGLRVVCAADITKFCADKDGRKEQRRCLKANEDKVSEDCRAILARKHGGKNDDDNDKANSDVKGNPND